MHGFESRPRIAVTLEQCWHRVPGGTARAALDLVDALRAMGEVELVGVAARHRTQPVAPWIPGVPVGMLPVPRAVLYETWHRLGWPPVERAVGSVDVIHVTGLATPPRSAPMVVTLHDLAFLRFPHYFTRHGLRFFHAALERIRADADLVVCSSQATRGDAIDAGIAEDRLRVVPLGVSAPTIDVHDIENVRRRLDLRGRYVLHLGTAEPRKNAGALTRMVPRLPEDVTVVFAGGAGWGDGDHIGKGGHRTLDAGFISEADKWALLAGASVFCYPSFWEGFGLPVAEAMAVGTPVVTSASTSLEEVVGNAGVCVDPEDDDALVSAVCSILDDPAVASDLSTRGRARAAELTWTRTSAEMIAAYHEVLAW